MRRAVPVICLAACGRFGFDQTPVQGEAGVPPNEAATDVPDAGATCWDAWRTGPLVLAAPQPVTGLDTSAAEGDPSLSADGLTLYFARANPTANDLFVTTRPDRSSPFGSAIRVVELSTAGDETKLTLSSDGLVAIWSSDRAGSMGFDLWQAVRATPTGAFQGATQAPFAQINNNQDQFDPHLSSDGLRLYFAPSQNMMQIVQLSTRTALTASWSAPVDVVNLGTGVHADPTLSPDELVLVYSARQNSGSPMILWYATRSTITVPFSNAQPVPGINAGNDYHQDPLLSSDGCELFFSNHATPSPDLYVSAVL